MRTLLASVLALALAIPAAVTPAAACGGYADLAPVHHVARGGVVNATLHRNDAGRLQVFISYPTIDGERSGLYGIFAELEDDRATRAFARLARAKGGARLIALEVERTGESGPWRVVSYTLGARA
jgi:hypothetical protein